MRKIAKKTAATNNSYKNIDEYEYNCRLFCVFDHIFFALLLMCNVFSVHCTWCTYLKIYICARCVCYLAVYRCQQVSAQEQQFIVCANTIIIFFPGWAFCRFQQLLFRFSSSHCCSVVVGVFGVRFQKQISRVRESKNQRHYMKTDIDK